MNPAFMSCLLRENSDIIMHCAEAINQENAAFQHTAQPRSQGSLLPVPMERTWERGCTQHCLKLF